MRYAKIVNGSGILERTEKRKSVLVNGTEITKNEFDNLSAGIEIFVCGFPSKSILAKYFPASAESEVEE